MLKKIRSLVSSYDEKFFAWLEGKSSKGSQRDRKTSGDNHEGSRVSERGVVPKRNVLQIPDPWD